MRTMRGTMDITMAAPWNQRETTSAGSVFGMQVMTKNATAAVAAASTPITKPIANPYPQSDRPFQHHATLFGYKCRKHAVGTMLIACRFCHV